jgi:hypothetical protein
MDARLEQVIIETLTTDRPQVIISAVDLDELYESTDALMQTHHSVTTLQTTRVQAPLLPDLVGGLLQRLWDNQVKWGSGDPFADVDLPEEDEMDEEDWAGICGNIAVQQVLRRLVPLSKRRDPSLSLLIDAYCVGAGCTPAELRELGLSRSLSRQDQLDLLIVLLSETNSPWRVRAMDMGAEAHLVPAPRLIMEINHLQYITHCSPLDVRQFTAALAYILDSMGDGFTLWLNNDDDDPLFIEEIRRALGPHFMLYVTHDLTA